MKPNIEKDVASKISLEKSSTITAPDFKPKKMGLYFIAIPMTSALIILLLRFTGNELAVLPVVVVECVLLVYLIKRFDYL